MGLREFTRSTGITDNEIPTPTTPSANYDTVYKSWVESYFASRTPTIVTGTYDVPTAKTNATLSHGTSTALDNIMFIHGSGADTTLAGSPIIQNGAFVGQRLVIHVPAAGTYKITIPASGNIRAGGTCVLAPGSRVAYEWDGAYWYETARRTV